MLIPLRQSTAGQIIPLGPYLNKTDGDTEESALTIANTDIGIWKNGALDYVSKNSGGATYASKGEYSATFDATDTSTLGYTKIAVHVAGALYVYLHCLVMTQAAYDIMVGTKVLGDATDLWANPTRTLTSGTKDAEIDAIKAITDELPDAGALTSKANEATVLTVDTVVDNILLDTNELQTNQGDWATATGFLTDKTGFSLSAAGITAVWSESLGDGSLTVKQAVNLAAIFAAAKASGGNTTEITLRNLSDTVDAVVKTVDTNGNCTETVITL